MVYDILIKNATIIDGTGKAKFNADIGIQDGLIKDVGLLGDKEAKRVIGATGRFVAPGFIDITSHSDSNGSLFQNPLQESSLTQGVTTIVVGNCGVSLAPLGSAEATKSFGKWQDISSANINWQSLGEFLDELARHRLGVNVATLVGHNTIRRGVIGDEVRPLLPDEILKMQYLIDKSLKEGAFGFSTSLSNSHEEVATTEEIIAIVRALGRSGGIYKTHLRNEGRDILSAVNEAIRVGRETGVPVAVSHLKTAGRRAWAAYPKAIKMIENARDDGIKIHFDVFPYARTGSFLYQLLPRWARAGGFKDMFQRFRDKDARQKILGYLKPETYHFEKIIIASADNPAVNGKSIKEIAEISGRAPEETMLDLILSSKGRATVFGRTLSAKNIPLGLKAKFAAVASDGGAVSKEFIKSGKLAHPRSFGTFPHFLHKYVRDKGLMPWEEGIRKITSLPADIIGIKGRGRIFPKYHADLVIFGPEVIRDQATYQNPHLPSKGVDWVIVNGHIAIENGKVTGVGAGSVLKRT